MIKKEDVRVFVDPDAAAALDDQTLDADVSPSGTRMSLYLSRTDGEG
nr:hypothetical protein GCM10020093_107050 [Planobispora longispora]